MKKTLVAVAVAALAATSANAAVVYNQDGTKVEVGGQLRLLLAKDKHERADLKYGSSRIVAKATHDLGDGYSALGNVEIRFNDPGSSDAGAYAKRLYAGFAKDGVGQLTFGKQLTNLDDVGLSDYTYDLGGINLTQTEANKDVRFRSADFGGFQFGLDYFFGNAYNGDDNTRNTYNTGAGFGASAFYSAAVAADTKLSFEAGYSEVKVGSSLVASSEHKQKAFIVGAELASGPFALAVDYSQAKATDDKDILVVKAPHEDVFNVFAVNKIQQLEVGAKYQYMDNAKVYGEYIYRKGSFANSNAEKVKVNEFILGTDYLITKNVITYFEAGTANVKYDGDSERDNKFRVGLRVLF